MRLLSMLNVFLVWVLFSLLAIAFIGDRPYLSLAIALVGGVVLGFVSLQTFEVKSEREE